MTAAAMVARPADTVEARLTAPDNLRLLRPDLQHALPVVDLSAIGPAFDWNVGILRDLTGSFVTEAVTIVCEIAASLRISGDRDCLQRAVHNLKGSALQIGAPYLGRLALMIEDATRHDDWDEVQRLAPLLPPALAEYAIAVGTSIAAFDES